jgi:Zn-dependent protease with chaperone function/tetratricopeptide (TPR) repeat protein
MNPELNLLQAGISAMQKQQYLEAVESLEAFCRQNTGSKPSEYFEAQRWLIKAYQRNGQVDLAIYLCQQMTDSSQAQTRSWAKSNLEWLQEESGLTADNAQVPPAVADNGSIPPIPAIENFIPLTAAALDAGVDNSDISQLQGNVDPANLLPPTEVAKLLKDGQKALKMGRFSEAIKQLETLCGGVAATNKDLAQAQMSLVKAYQGNEQTDRAIALCRQLTISDKDYVQIWATQFLTKLAPDIVIPAAAPAQSSHAAAPESSWGGSDDEDEDDSNPDTPTQPVREPFPKAGRAENGWVKFIGKGVTANLGLASAVTLSLLFGMVLVLSLVIIPHDLRTQNPTLWLGLSVSMTIGFNLLMFFVAPYIMDVIQQLLYSTRWTSLSEIERHSPESAKIIREVCRQKNLREPQLGIIDDNNPTAFTYGSLPNSARLVVSKGLFHYLDDDEAATVYAHELGHIVHWDFAVMTLASTLVQITYLVYVYGRQVTRWLGNSSVEKNIKHAAQNAAWIAYIFYVVGEFMLLYLSRIREYHADRFAAEVTGNPNALSRALVKIAYGITEEERQHPDQSKVMLRGTRALGICDGKAAGSSGAAYRAATTPRKVGKVFLWDMFNPWAWWMELMSTHPLTGKRIRALSTYAEQLGLASEYDMAAIVKEGNGLNKERLYRSFFGDLLLMFAPPLGFFGGLSMGLVFAAAGGGWRVAVCCTLIGLGLGLLLKMVVMYPDYDLAIDSDVLTLMSDPYANPLRGRPVKLKGEIIGRADSGNKAGANLVLHDATGKIALLFSSRFGWLGNFWFGWTQAESLINEQVTTVGWFRRGIASRVDLVSLDCPRIPFVVSSYHRFWTVVYGLGSIGLGLAIPLIFR